MELKEFVVMAITDIDSAVTEVNENRERKFVFKGVRANRTALDFDIAVSIETSESGDAKGGIKVLAFSVGATADASIKNSTVSRVRFGVDYENIGK